MNKKRKLINIHFHLAYVTNETLSGSFITVVNGTEEYPQLGGYKSDRSQSICGLKAYSVRNFDFVLIFLDSYMRRLQLPKVSSLNMRVDQHFGSGINYLQLDMNTRLNTIVEKINEAECEESQQMVRMDLQFIREHGYSKTLFVDQPNVRISILGDLMRVRFVLFINIIQGVQDRKLLSCMEFQLFSPCQNSFHISNISGHQLYFRRGHTENQ